MRILFLIAIMLLVPFLSASSAKADDENQRSCAAADFTGVYTLIDLQETPKGSEATWFQQYHNHYLLFYPFNAYAYIALLHTPATVGDLKKSVDTATSSGSYKVERKYTFDPATSILNLYVDKALDYSYRCMVAVKGMGKIHPGDIILTGYSKRRTELFKLFRHWQ